MHAWHAPVIPPLPTLAASAEAAPLHLHDSSSREVAPVRTGAEASLYVCGITPYDATHMGHAATYVSFDLLNRLWRAQGRDVSYVQNVTDVDDPLLERAEATGVDWQDLAKEQTDLFRRDMEALRVIPPAEYIGAVESVEWIVPVVERMLADGYAYRVPGGESEPDGDVYFDSAAAANSAWHLGAVSGYDTVTMATFFAERGGDPERAGKRNALDPMLWRVARDGEPQWDGGSLGAGRPGWHIECSVIARRFLPAPFTVQGGGSDLIFPHHEFSAGHASAQDDTVLAEHFVHAGMVGLDGEKMSKSKGNLVLVSKLRETGTDPMAIRAVLLGQHYRSDWFWTDALLTAAAERLSAWSNRLSTATRAEADSLPPLLMGHLANDLDAPSALAELDAWAASAPEGETDSSAREELVDAIDALLGLKLVSDDHRA
ncbi:cysteine--1-D-myo-inosityl 2-amino-2-deoxy-alpha-D-glucopyranoside ligase [Zhihengliuella halotolerans]|uniref:L-cysteine:1D-myo-inositol 2-amino-2-deoxy-alpha-D-glucopyranoside ligase n=1 Tax=Zhihengliuella halotolerans TaxID=370736 RepID=A0A4Q8ABK4_9MICC|nr:cysteine--1-D-myo-inosityl 2-amino-2-deoxy-alpha-D-glucopyranoside ligase [Zhihengliuella halotolerans]RZU61414.1 L-cysteine:1D-myo-inositol 2-amino-2-deoxy-alpha-D-glucopyranoside ligase [Zhihengliuella halotolerans]